MLLYQRHQVFARLLILSLSWGSSLYYSRGIAAQSSETLDRLVFDAVPLSEQEPSNQEQRSARIPGGNSSPELQLDTQAQNPSPAILEYQAEIAEARDEYGAYSPESIQDLRALGRLYQQENLHQQALETFETANHLIRVNEGLYHSLQITVIESMIKSLLALEEFRAALNHQRYLLILNQRNTGTGSIETLNAMMGLGDRYRDKFRHTLMTTEVKEQLPGERYRIGERSFDLTRDQSRILREFAIGDLSRAKNAYLDAITAAGDNGMTSHPQLIDMEYRFLETLFLLGYAEEMILDTQYYLTRARRQSGSLSRWGYLRRNTNSYATGREAYERILSYLANDPAATPEARLNAALSFGDWHLLFGRDDAARKQYLAAYTSATKAGMSPETVEAIFTPAIPTQLPLITPKPNSREMLGIGSEETLSYEGYIDVSFSINRNGSARSIRLLGGSESGNRKIEKRLRKYLRNAPFRPFVSDGEVVRKVPVRMRYYYVFLPE